MEPGLVATKLLAMARATWRLFGLERSLRGAQNLAGLARLGPDRKVALLLEAFCGCKMVAYAAQQPCDFPP